MIPPRVSSIRELPRSKMTVSKIKSVQVNALPADDVEVLHTRTYFYVGGRNARISNTPHGSGIVKTEQIYVERLIPAVVHHDLSIVLWTGLGQTGASWLNTPDGRRGWASHFLAAGYIVYIADQPARGRSPLLPVPYNDTNIVQSVIPDSYAVRSWTAHQKYSGDSWLQASQHTQWPGTGELGDPVFDAFWASQVPSLKSQAESEELSKRAGRALLQTIRQPVVLLTHSSGGPHGWAIADECPGLVKAIVAVEPQGPPFFNNVNACSGSGIVRPWGITKTEIRYDPPVKSSKELLLDCVTLPPDREGRCSATLQGNKPRQLTNLAEVSVLVVTGESGYHAVYDWCTVEYLRQAGVQVDHLDLAEHGIKGNSHFMFLERNNTEIWERIHGWLLKMGS